MQSRLAAVLGLSTSLLLAPGCTADSPDRGKGAERTIAVVSGPVGTRTIPQGAAQTVGDDFTPGEYVDESGRKWLRRRIRKKSEIGEMPGQSTTDAIEDDLQSAASPGFVNKPSATAIPAEHDLRGVTRVGDIEYVEVATSPKALEALAMARKFPRARTSRSRPGKLELVEAPVSFSDSDRDNESGLSTDPQRTEFATNNAQAIVTDPDDRFYVNPVDRYSDRNAMQIYFLNSCSATMIGRRTALTAAHCIYDIPTGTYAPYPQTWKIGLVKHRWLATESFTEYTTYPVHSGCYYYWFPSKYMTTGLNEYDYAVIEFDCGLNPGDTVGFLPIGWGTDSDYILASTTEMRGYDAVPQMPPGYLIGWTNPSLIGRAYGTWTVSITASILLRVWMDATAGSSGAGIMQQLFSTVGDPTFYYTGTLHGKEADLSDHLIARRMDPTAYAFISAYTSEW